MRAAAAARGMRSSRCRQRRRATPTRRWPPSPRARKVRLMDALPAQPALPAGNVIDLEKVRVTFGSDKNQVTALAETSLRITHGEFVALVGPSGCGKSTILKLVAGTLTASQGNVFVAGREVGANHVRIGMAFQNPTLLPWLNVRDNVMMPLKIVPPFKQDFSR